MLLSLEWEVWSFLFYQRKKSPEIPLYVSASNNLTLRSSNISFQQRGIECALYILVSYTAPQNSCCFVVLSLTGTVECSKFHINGKQKCQQQAARHSGGEEQRHRPATLLLQYLGEQSVAQVGYKVPAPSTVFHDTVPQVSRTAP